VKPGPRPTPTNLRILQGAPPRRTDVSEAIPPPTDLPECPPWLNEYARQEWDRLAADLYGMGVLTGIDQTMLAAFCTAYSRWRTAEEDLQKQADEDDETHGAIIDTINGNKIQNPLMGVANAARRDMQRLAVEFGLTPSSRTLIDAGKRGEVDPIGARYFGRK
jgi:P27 family predicted phage terminase small subunit